MFMACTRTATLMVRRGLSRYRRKSKISRMTRPRGTTLENQPSSQSAKQSSETIRSEHHPSAAAEGQPESLSHYRLTFIISLLTGGALGAVISASINVHYSRQLLRVQTFQAYSQQLLFSDLNLREIRNKLEFHLDTPFDRPGALHVLRLF
jgi:hypothetical protein